MCFSEGKKTPKEHGVIARLAKTTGAGSGGSSGNYKNTSSYTPTGNPVFVTPTWTDPGTTDPRGHHHGSGAYDAGNSGGGGHHHHDTGGSSWGGGGDSGGGGGGGDSGGGGGGGDSGGGGGGGF